MHLCFCSVRCCKAHRKRFLLYQTRGATPSEIRISFVVTLIVLRLFLLFFFSKNDDTRCKAWESDMT